MWCAHIEAALLNVHFMIECHTPLYLSFIILFSVSTFQITVIILLMVFRLAYVLYFVVKICHLEGNMVTIVSVMSVGGKAHCRLVELHVLTRLQNFCNCMILSDHSRTGPDRAGAPSKLLC